MTDIRRHIILIIFSLAFAFCASAQPVEHIELLKPRHLKKMAANAVTGGDPYSAIMLFDRYLFLKPGYLPVMQQLADLHRYTRNYTVAAELYKSIIEKDPNAGDAMFYAGCMLKSQGKYDEAKEMFEKFEKNSKSSSDIRILKKLSKIEREGCEIASSVIGNPLNMNAVRLDTSINKPHIEFSPLPINDSLLLYASFRTDSITYYTRDEYASHYPSRKFYLAEKIDNRFKFKSMAPYPLNDPEQHNGNGTFSLDRKRFYFTRCAESQTGKVICKLWRCNYENGRWSQPEVLPDYVNLEGYTSTMPAVGIEPRKKQEVLFFTSDRPSGKGGLDIWFTVYDEKNDKYKNPRNVGNKINTVGDELTPFFDEEVQSLYFSSNGWPGIGGYDIFKSSGNLTSWSKPVNVGYPINSAADDLYFVFIKREKQLDPEPDREEGFIVSNRAGGANLLHATCCDDIFSLQWLDKIKVSVKGEVFLIKADSAATMGDIFFENLEKVKAIRKQIVDSAVVSLYFVDDNGEEVYLTTDTTNGKGEYFFKLEIGKNYKIDVEKDGFLPKETGFNTLDISRSDTLDISFGLKEMPIEPFVIKNIYYPFDKTYLTDNAKIIIDTTLYRLLIENPSLIVEISSHTDSKGSEQYNVRLSQGRAESVVIYLI
ncbi:MAG: OmpA family protein, partial [Bacteroidetes bacterium]|nr:OmpA family protein [Bacteroidota bacterium]